MWTGVLERLRRLWGVRAASALSAAALVAAALVAASITLVLLQERAVHSTIEAQVRDYAVAVADRLGAGDTPADAISEQGRGFAVAQILDTAGRVLAASPQVAGAPALWPGQPAAATNDAAVHDVASATDSDALLVVEVGAGTQSVPLVVLAAGSLAATERGEQAATDLLLAGIPLIALIAGAATYAFSGLALRPVEDIRATVAAMTDRDLSSRVPEPFARDEVGRLARTMNDLLGRLEASQRRQRRFVADASHELRSPLTTILARLELGQRRGPNAVDVAAMMPEARRMARLVDDLLLLARADERGLRSRCEDVDLDELLEVEGARLRSEGTAVRLDTHPARVRGDHGQLTRVIRNLAENAARHATSRVVLHSELCPGYAVVRVSDDGPGIPAAERQRVFERFVRLNDDRARETGGAGLGLAIVAEIVAAHDGTVAALEPVAASDGAGGALIEIRLPVAADSAAALRDSGLR